MFVHIVSFFVAFCGLSSPQTSRADDESREQEKTTYSRNARQPDASGTKHLSESETAVLTYDLWVYIASLNACGLDGSARCPYFAGACFLNDAAIVLNPFVVEHVYTCLS